MTQLVLITRPEEQARQFAKEVEKAGFSPFLSPLLHVEYIPTHFNDDDAPDALLLSSVQALEVSIPPSWFHIPVFCVGDVSASNARQKGFINVVAGSGGIIDLAGIIKQRLPLASSILYLRGENIHQNIHDVLMDYDIRELITYRAQPVAHLAADLLDIFAQISVVTLFSARTAIIFKDLIEKNALAPYLKSIKLLSLSPSVVESVKEMGWKSIHVADFPSQAAMIEKLKSI